MIESGQHTAAEVIENLKFKLKTWINLEIPDPSVKKVTRSTVPNLFRDLGTLFSEHEAEFHQALEKEKARQSGN